MANTFFSSTGMIDPKLSNCNVNNLGHEFVKAIRTGLGMADGAGATSVNHTTLDGYRAVQLCFERKDATLCAHLARVAEKDMAARAAKSYTGWEWQSPYSRLERALNYTGTLPQEDGGHPLDQLMEGIGTDLPVAFAADPYLESVSPISTRELTLALANLHYTVAAFIVTSVAVAATLRYVNLSGRESAITGALFLAMAVAYTDGLTDVHSVSIVILTLWAWIATTLTYAFAKKKDAKLPTVHR